MANLLSRTSKTALIDDYTYLMSNNGSSDGKTKLEDFTAVPETSRTINLNNSMTATDINNEINTVGKYLPSGVVVTFQFANGTYSLDNILYFNGFYGGGRIHIQGDTSQTNGLHTNHNVHLNFNNDTEGLYCLHNSCNDVHIEHLKITVDDGYRCILLHRACYSSVSYCYIINNGQISSSSRGIEVNNGQNTYLLNNYFSNNYYAIAVFECSKVNSTNNDDTGTQPKYGLRVALAADVGKNGTQPSGSTADELVNVGGEVR